MIVTLEPGISIEDPQTAGVIERAKHYGLNPEAQLFSGETSRFVQVHLKDTADRKAGSVRTDVFANLPGVKEVQRVSATLIGARRIDEHHPITVAGRTIGEGKPCQLILGPCTVDRNTDAIVEYLTSLGCTWVRGGARKPRSQPDGYPGMPNGQGYATLIGAAAKHGIECVFTEVMEPADIATAEEAVQQLDYRGELVYWIGARTNSIPLQEALARQKRPVMIKNGLNGSIPELIRKAEWIMAGERDWQEDGSLNPEASLRPGPEIIYCWRGCNPEGVSCKPYRGLPMHEMIEILRHQLYGPVGCDPSHSAGTSSGLVLKNARRALEHNPAFLMIEVYLDHERAPCDADQAVPLSQVPEIIAMVSEHNQKSVPT